MHLDTHMNSHMNNHADSVQNMVRVLQRNNIHATAEQVYIAWSEYSEAMAAGWIVSSDETQIVSAYTNWMNKKITSLCEAALQNNYHSDIVELVTKLTEEDNDSSLSEEDAYLIMDLQSNKEIARLPYGFSDIRHLELCVAESLNMTLPKGWKDSHSYSVIEGLGLVVK